MEISRSCVMIKLEATLKRRDWKFFPAVCATTKINSDRSNIPPQPRPVRVSKKGSGSHVKDSYLCRHKG